MSSTLSGPVAFHAIGEAQLSRILAVIPARLASERLPRKPLQPLNGRPLIEWVWKAVIQLATPTHVVVATDSEEIAAVCYGFGADVVMTRESHKSGTERVAEVAALETNRAYDVVVNVQGDEPFIREEHMAGSVRMVLAGFDIGTVGAPIDSLDAYMIRPSSRLRARSRGARSIFRERRFRTSAAKRPRAGSCQETNTCAMLVSTPTRALLWLAGYRCRKRDSSTLRNWSSCVPSQPA